MPNDSSDDEIQFTFDDIKAIEPTISEEDAELVMCILLVVNVQDLLFGDVFGFGSEVQIEHGQIARAELEIASSEFLKRGEQCLSEMLAIIDLLDPNKIFSSQILSFEEWMKALVFDPEPPAKVFTDNFPRLQRLAEEMAILERHLIQLVNDLAELKTKYDDLVRQISHYSLAAKIITKQTEENLSWHPLPNHHASQIRIMEARVISLLTTRASLEMGMRNNEILSRLVCDLIENTKGIRGEDLPALQNAYTLALISIRESKYRIKSATWFTSLIETHSKVALRLTGKVQSTDTTK